jgi:uncharacterized protein YyaL (SSP411 family)
MLMKGVNYMSNKPNRLIKEKSPYLLQHAYNPVDWYPWGEEAFQKADKEKKPVFLSIGYSTCHWCHVMEKESFEDSDVARIMNESLVPIKVDREERPDIDNVYMSVCQVFTGSGGWPLNIFMTPDKKPFYAATYIPKESRSGRLGMVELIPKIMEIWHTKNDELRDSANEFSSALKASSEVEGGEDLGEEILTSAFEQFSQIFDKENGGFGTSPKFPTPHNLTFLLRYWKRTGKKQALAMVEKTLSKMRLGGIYDHIGFGFHRYSTDKGWFTPHFEKMLYDQALLAMAYMECYQATKKEGYGETAREIFTYILRDMVSPEGCFYSGEDADSEGEEGKFYVWNYEEIKNLSTAEEAEILIKAFNIEKEGNFRDEATGEQTGRNILYLKKPIPELSAEFGITSGDLLKILDTCREKLLSVRNKRIRPQRDNKILTDWNGLMIAALAKGAALFHEAKYLKAADSALQFIFAKMRSDGGRLYHRYCDGEAAIKGFLDDYVFLIHGLLELYEASLKGDYIKKALELNRILLDHFWDKKQGCFYMTSDDAEEVLLRKKEVYDGAVPSGNSVAFLNLLHLSRLTGDPEFEEKAAQIRKAFSRIIVKSPHAFTQFLNAMDFAIGPSYEVVIVGREGAEDTNQLIDAVRKEFIPNKTLIFKTPDFGLSDTDFAKFTANMSCIGDKATAYICKDFKCSLPTTDREKVLEMLNAGIIS